MSYPVRYESLSKELKNYINEHLIIKIEDDDYGNNSYKVALFSQDKEHGEVYLPMRFRFDPIIEGYDKCYN